MRLKMKIQKISRVLSLLPVFLGISMAASFCNSTHFEETNNTSLSILTTAVFQKCGSFKPENIDLSNNAIGDIEHTTFLLQYNCHVLNLSSNSISVLTPDLLLTMAYLADLDLSHNYLVEFPSKFLNNKLYLEKIDLSYNGLFHIASDAFDPENSGHLRNLKMVDLSHNNLQAFQPWLHIGFQPRNFADRQVDMSWNNISTYKNPLNWTNLDNTFLYGLVYTDLRHNAMREWDDWYVKQYMLDKSTPIDVGVTQISIDFRDNNWLCDCRFHNLVKQMSTSLYKYAVEDYAEVKCAEPSNLKDKLIIYDIRLDDFICNVTENCPNGCVCEDIPEKEVLKMDCRSAGMTELPRTIPHLKYGFLELLLDHNQITKLDHRTYLQNLKTLTMSSNQLSSIDTESVKSFRSDLGFTLDFSNNVLERVPQELQVFRYEATKLSGNKLTCDCDMLWMTEWINLAPSYEDRSLHCTTADGVSHNIIDLTEDLLECVTKYPLALIVILSLVLLVIIILLITAKRCPYETKVIIFKIFRIHPADKYVVDTAVGMEYDMYVSCDAEDPYIMQWVRKKLLKNLEEKKPYFRVCVAERSLIPGVSEAEQRCDYIDKSRRMMIILTEGYTQNEWNQFESSQSQTMDLSDGRLLFLLYDDDAVALSKEEPWLSYTRDRKVFTPDERMLWDKIRYELPARNK